MGANNSGSGSRSKSGDSQLKAYKEQYEGAKRVLAREREKLADVRKGGNKSAIQAQKGAVERAKQYVERCKGTYDSYRR